MRLSAVDAGLSPAIRKYGLLLALCTAAMLMAMLAARHQAGEIEEGMFAVLLTAAAGLVALLWPLLETSSDAEPMAPLIAFVGCDGSGKSTLSSDILARIGQDQRVQLCYLGLGSGDLGLRIRQLPLVGPSVERLLAKKAGQTRTQGQKIPGLATALVVYLFSLARLRRFRRMLALRREGVAVITDRYPQTEVAGFYDGPGLSAASAGSWLVAWLARHERRMYEWMASFRPDVVIRLNVDLDTAHARKPDHPFSSLRDKVAVTPLLRFNGAHIVDLDSGEPYAAVRDAAMLTVRRTLNRPTPARAAA